MPKFNRDELMRLIRQHFNEDAQRMLTFTRWKDGIDVQYSTYAIEAFADAVYEAGRAEGGKYGWQPDKGGEMVSCHPAPDAARGPGVVGKTYKL